MNKIILFNFLIFSLSFGQTAEQIKQAKDYIEQTGMSESQVREIAKSRGYSDKQIDDAYKLAKSQNAGKGQGNIIENEIISPLVKNNDKTVSNNNGKKIDSQKDINLKNIDDNQYKSEELPYFGYDIFNQDPELFQSLDVGAVDPDYLIGPGDEIILMLWGETQFRQLLSVDREGFIFIPEIGQVFVNGLNLNLLESKLFRVLSKSYSSLNPNNGKATTFLDISLGNLRPLRIQVIGEVSRPGAYTVSPSSTLFSALYYFNGPTKLGSLRDIKLIRGGEEIASIDFYNYLLTGKKIQDEKLQLDDIIYVPKRMKTVSIKGEINRSGIYELKANESLSDLIDISGGLKVSAYLNRAQIDRILPFNLRSELGMDRTLKDVNIEDAINSDNIVNLYDGDKIEIFSIYSSRRNVVYISGAVGRPGSYDLGKELKLFDLIMKADSLVGDAYLDRVDIIRTMPDLKEELIKLNLSSAINGDPENNISLSALDRVRVYGTREMIAKKSVVIKGHVKYPGIYPLIENMTLYDLIFRTGGFIDDDFRDQALQERADLVRKNKDGFSQKIIPFNLSILLDSKGKEQNFNLNSGDVVNIYSKSVTKKVHSVTIKGSVKNPGVYSYKTDMNLNDLILESGGIDNNVYDYNVEIARINPKNFNRDVLAESISTINLNVNSFIKDSSSILLKPYDFISIRPNPYFGLQKSIHISGMVKYPGDYVILKPNEKLSSIIERAGGLRANAFISSSEFKRNSNTIMLNLGKIIKKPNSRFDIDVNSGDTLYIPENPNMISVIGEVSSPGFYKYVPGLKIKRIIKEAGGFSQNAERNDIFIRYADGKSKKYTRWSNPKVSDGSTIIVGTKKEEEPFDRTEYLSRLSAIIANIAQALSLIIIARG